MTYRLHDQHFTPAPLAQALITSLQNEENFVPKVIFDPTCGDGALLEAAIQRWPRAKLRGNDVDERVVAELQVKHPKWHLSTSDFLTARAELPKGAHQHRADLILLNPPFSCRGGTRYALEGSNYSGTCSIALAFVLRALESLKKGGILLAILPRGVLGSQKDREAWYWLEQRYSLQVLNHHPSRAFPSCTVETVTVRFTSFNSAGSFQEPCVPLKPIGHPLVLPFGTVQVKRGQLQMHTYTEPEPEQSSVPLIHTDSLRDHAWIGQRRIARTGVRVLEGPLLLLSRVGKPDVRKLVLIPTVEAVCLSDCVIAVQGDSKALELLRKGLCVYWDELKNVYGGSCARHLTIEKFETFLLSRAGAMLELSKLPEIRRKQRAKPSARAREGLGLSTD